MSLLDITSFLGDLDKILEDPAWLFFGIIGGIAVLGLLALLLLYPISGDTDSTTGV
jgi:hypothetical protein